VKPDDEVIELLYDAEIAIPRVTESSVAASDARKIFFVASEE
jgi:hypothetical protein